MAYQASVWTLLTSSSGTYKKHGNYQLSHSQIKWQILNWMLIQMRNRLRLGKLLLDLLRKLWSLSLDNLKLGTVPLFGLFKMTMSWTLLIIMKLPKSFGILQVMHLFQKVKTLFTSLKWVWLLRLSNFRFSNPKNLRKPTKTTVFVNHLATNMDTDSMVILIVRS